MGLFLANCPAFTGWMHRLVAVVVGFVILAGSRLDYEGGRQGVRGDDGRVRHREPDTGEGTDHTGSRSRHDRDNGPVNRVARGRP
jgi:hypothetical protein